MTISEIFEIIKTHKRFSTYYYDPDFQYIDCYLSENAYTIKIDDKGGKLTFTCDLYNIGMQDIKVELSKWYSTESHVLSKFSEVIRFLKKADFFRIKKSKDLAKVKPFILDLIKNEYSLDPLDINVFKFDFPQSAYRVRGKLRTENFNIRKEKKKSEIKYRIYVCLENDIFKTHSFYFDYYGENNLILTLRTEKYRVPVDLTRVIRSERLKNLMLCECE